MGKWTAGGKYAWNAGRNTLKLDTTVFDSLLQQIEKMGGNVKRATETVLGHASTQIYNDTKAVTIKPNFPAGGIYSYGYTEESIVEPKQIEWQGTVASVPVGFNFSRKGNGGYLITGTPRMRPVPELNKMYKGKAYMTGIQNGMYNDMLRILRIVEGSKKG